MAAIIVNTSLGVIEVEESRNSKNESYGELCCYSDGVGVRLTNGCGSNFDRRYLPSEWTINGNSSFTTTTDVVVALKAAGLCAQATGGGGGTIGGATEATLQQILALLSPAEYERVSIRTTVAGSIPVGAVYYAIDNFGENAERQVFHPWSVKGELMDGYDLGNDIPFLNMNGFLETIPYDPNPEGKAIPNTLRVEYIIKK